MASTAPVTLPPFEPANLELEDRYHVLQATDLEFFHQRTGIQDPDELKKHIITVQREAYAVHPYPCIRLLGFARLKISRLPPFQTLLKLGKERPGALFLDIGCCVGTDVRKAIADGFPMKQALASDLRPEFWDIGHKLFKDTPESFPVPFLAGDAFDDAFLASAPIASRPPADALPDITSLTSLNPLHGRLSAIHASSFFHLFTEDKQLELAKRVASLLSPEPGSIIFGMHGGRPEKGLRIEARTTTTHGIPMFCHCPESWKELWTKEVFGEGQIKVDAQLFEVERKDLSSAEGSRFWMLVWCVTRL